MGKEIRLRIEACYGDLRPSEKRAADYVLEHLEELKLLPLNQLAEQAKVSQPTVMRMIKALGYSGYKEFRYAVVEKLARREKAEDRGFEGMYGYSLTGKERTEEIPAKIVATAGSMAGEMLKNISTKIFSQVIEALGQARRIDIYSVENSNVTAQGSADETPVFGTGLPALWGQLSAGHLRRELKAGRCGGGRLLLGQFPGYGGRGEGGQKGGGHRHSDYEFPGFPDYAVRGSAAVHQPGSGVLRGRDLFQDDPDHDCGYDLYGASGFGLRAVCKNIE